MKKEKLTELRVGLFVFMGGVLALLTVFFVGGEQTFFSSTYELKARFSSTSGLREGAVVQLSGVRIGEVRKIDFSSSLSDPNVMVYLELNKSHQDRIRGDSVATIKTQGLLGDKFIAISMGTEAKPALKNEDMLQTKEEASFADVMGQTQILVDDLKVVTASLRKLFQNELGQEKGDVVASLASLKKIMEEIEKGDGVAHALIYDDSGKKAMNDLAAALKAFRAVSEDLEKGEGTVGKLLQDPALYYDLREVMGRVNRNKLFRTVVRETLEQNDKQVLK